MLMRGWCSHWMLMASWVNQIRISWQRIRTLHAGRYQMLGEPLRDGRDYTALVLDVHDPQTWNKSTDFTSAVCIQYSSNWWGNRLCWLDRRWCFCLWGSIKHIAVSQRESVITLPGLDFKQALFILPCSKSSTLKTGLNQLVQRIWFCLRFSVMTLLMNHMTNAWNYAIACIWIYCFPLILCNCSKDL